MSFHLYRINELYSNADGSIQYMEMVVGDADGEGFWQGQPLTVSQGGAVHRYLFPSDLPGFTTANTTVLIATQGVDTLLRVERLYFADVGLAFDVDGSAGSTARLIGASFGASFIEPGLSGVGIRIFDGGLTMFAQLAGGRDNESVVRTLYENVVGQPPPAAELLCFVGLLEAGMTQAQLLAFAAQHELNAQRIGLAGLAANGLEYL